MNDLITPDKARHALSQFQTFFPNVFEGLLLLKSEVDSLITWLQTDQNTNKLTIQHRTKEGLSEVSLEPVTTEYRSFNLLRKSGEGWEICYHGNNRFWLRDTVGLKYIAILLQNPNRSIHVSELVAISHNNGNRKDRKDVLFTEGLSVKAGAVRERCIDSTCLSELRKKLQDLEEKQTDARERGDYEGVEKAQEEILEITEYLQKDGYQRDPDIERIRVSVRNAVRNSLQKIRKNDDELGIYLGNRIITGTYCRYEKYKTDRTEWQFS